MEENKLVNSIGILSLAFMGDAIYEDRVRAHVIRQCPTMKVNELHKEAVKFVKASAQAKAVLDLIREEVLSESEITVVKRGRNHASNSPKNADMVEYKYATGFEALLGYLYFIDSPDRMDEIIDKSINIINNCLKKNHLCLLPKWITSIGFNSF